MKICIVTVYNSINCGSWLQAYALKKYFEKCDDDVYFLKRNNIGSSASIMHKIINLSKKLLKYGPKKFYRQYLIYRDFNQKLKSFKIISKKSKIFKQIDCFVLGSDTIWNISEKYFYHNRKDYFGALNTMNSKIVTYAVSIGNTDAKMFDLNFKEYISKMDLISVRDVSTKNMVLNLCDRKPFMVCDPTLLLNPSDFDDLIIDDNVNSNKKFIFLYLFEKLSEQNADLLKKFAKEKKCTIINGVIDDKRFDKNNRNSPSFFLNCMKKSDYVITDTFHGLMFSLIYEKKFLVINRNKIKINEFMIENEIDNRLVNSEELLNINMLNKKFVLSKNRKIVELKKKSEEYLKSIKN